MHIGGWVGGGVVCPISGGSPVLLQLSGRAVAAERSPPICEGDLCAILSHHPLSMPTLVQCSVVLQY